MSNPTGERVHEPLSLRWKRMPEEEKRERIVDAVLLLIA